MPIHRDKATGRWRFEFSRRIGGQRLRRRTLLPAGWTRAQADAFDQKESGALYAIAKGIAKPRHTIDQAVARYTKERIPDLKAGPNTRRELEATRDWWTGRPIEDLADVCAEYAADQLQALKPATIKNRISYLRAACRWAWKRHGLGESDPGGRVVVPTVRNAREVIITRRQMLQLARACKHPGVRALIRVLFYTGLRVSEARRAQRLPGVLSLQDTKNGRIHVLPVHPRITTAVKVPIPPRSKIDYWWPLARVACGLVSKKLPPVRPAPAPMPRRSARSAGRPLRGSVRGIVGRLCRAWAWSAPRRRRCLESALQVSGSRGRTTGPEPQPGAGRSRCPAWRSPSATGRNLGRPAASRPRTTGPESR